MHRGTAFEPSPPVEPEPPPTAHGSPPPYGVAASARPVRSTPLGPAPAAAGRARATSEPPGGDGAPPRPAPERSASEPVPFYYSSKYARLDGLPRALDYGKAERLDVVQTYIGYVFAPPDGAGDPLENAQHLRGACARLMVGSRSENAALLMLNAFSVLAIEAAPAADRPSPTVRDAVRQARTAYRRFMETESWADLLAALACFSDRLAALHPDLRPLLDGLRQECVLYRTVRLLRETNQRLLSEPSA